MTTKSPIDFSIQEAMTPEQLQHLLRQFNGLDGANVGYPSDFSREAQPWMLKLSGAIPIYGNPHYWEVEIDIRNIETADDMLKLVGGLHKSFDKAARQIGGSL